MRTRVKSDMPPAGPLPSAASTVLPQNLAQNQAARLRAAHAARALFLTCVRTKIIVCPSFSQLGKIISLSTRTLASGVGQLRTTDKGMGKAGDDISVSMRPKGSQLI